MSKTNKKYFWFKLKEDFFRNKKIKKLRRIAGGDTYTIIYLKMQLLSLKDNGNLYFEDVEETFAEEIALEIDEDVDNVKVTLMFLLKNGLIEQVSEDEYSLVETKECIGSETASTLRSRKSRALKQENEQKALQCNTNATNCNTEIDIEKEIELRDKDKVKEIKRKYGEYQNVKLTDKEYNSLISEYGSSTDEIIKYLDEYIEMKGTKYKSCYMAIKKWVVAAVKEKKNRPNASNTYRREEIVPDWFNKDIQPQQATTEEQQEIEDMLKEYRPNPELQARLKERYGKGKTNL